MEGPQFKDGYEYKEIELEKSKRINQFFEKSFWRGFLPIIYRQAASYRGSESDPNDVLFIRSSYLFYSKTAQSTRGFLYNLRQHSASVVLHHGTSAMCQFRHRYNHLYRHSKYKIRILWWTVQYFKYSSLTLSITNKAPYVFKIITKV